MRKFILDINPATGELIEKIKCSSPGEIASGVKLARKASKVWSKVPLKKRIALFKNIARDLHKEKKRIGEIVTKEMGKIYKSAVGEADGTAYGIEENIKFAEKAANTEIFKEDKLIYENTSAEKFITFFWGILDSENNIFEYINAGHNPPIVLKKEKISQLTEGGFMIGILDSGINYEVGKVHLDKNDVIVFYTDGVTEANDKNGDEFGEERLTNVLKENKNNSANNILEQIKNSIVEFTKDTAQYDDITLIVLKKV